MSKSIVIILTLASILPTAALSASDLTYSNTRILPDKFTTALFHFDEQSNLFLNTSNNMVKYTSGDKTTFSAEGKYNGVLRLRLSQDKKTSITFAENEIDPASFSIDFWMKMYSESSLLSRDMYFLSGSRIYFRYNCTWNLACFEFGVQTAKGWVGVRTSKDTLIVKPNQWYHLAGICDGSEIRLYVDGQLISTAPVSELTRHGGYVLGACAWAGDQSSELDGWIDELRFSAIPRTDFGFSPKLSDQAGKTEGTANTKKTETEKPSQADLPYVVIPKVTQGPNIDGNPNGGIWDKAAWVGNPVYLNQNEITSKLDMRAGLLWDDDSLYVGFKCYQHRKPAAVTTSKGDDGLERDDAVEVTLEIPSFVKADGQPVQFKLNCEGLKDDAINFDFAWNPVWDGAVSREGNNWYATFKIPFANFGVKPRIADKWGANLGAFLVGYDYRAFLWTPVKTGHHHKGPFGTIEFGDTSIIGSSIEKIDKEMASIKISGSLAGQGTVRALLLSESVKNDKDVVDGFLIANFDTESQGVVRQASKKIDVSGNWEITLDNVSPGSYLIKCIVLNAAGKAVNIDVKPIKIEQSIETRILRYPVAGSADAVVTVYNMGKPSVKPAEVTMKLLDQNGQTIKTFHTEETVKLGKPLHISLGKLENGHRYKFITKAMTAQQDSVIDDIVEFELQQRPLWADTDAGLLHGKVLKPWTPITAKGTIMSCWGRSYDMADSLLPASIISGGHKILSDRIQIIVGSNDTTVQLNKTQEPVAIDVSKTGDTARFRTTADSGICNVKVDGSLEFDGFMAIDVELTPKKPVTLFTVEIPLENEIAEYIQPLPRVKNGDRTGFIPTEGISLEPLNTLWICSADAGLYFACDSTENWTAEHGKAVEIIRRDNDSVLKLNFFASMQGITTSRHYRFYLQATPIRPYNPDWFETGSRVMNGLLYGHNVTALENDTVLSIPIGTAAAEQKGLCEIILENEADLKAITEMDYQHSSADEKIFNISSPSGKMSLLYSKERNAMTLMTPWGELGLENNALWLPHEIHKLAFAWGDTLRFFIDGKEQGALNVTALPLPDAVLNLGSVSARYNMKGLRISKSINLSSLADITAMEKTADTLIFHSEILNLRSNAKTPLHVAKELGTKTLIFFENWCTAQNGGRSRAEPLLKEVVQDCHRLGLKIIFYFGFELADVPEHKDMIDECKGLVNQSPNFYAPAQMNTYWISYGGPYQEYLLYNMKRLKDEIGIDGVYLDGTLSLAGSDNPAFGCGYTDPNSNRVTTVPVLRIRSFAKRINNLFVQNGGTAFAHLRIVAPTMGFVSNTYLGEHVGFLSKEWHSISDVIPPDVARAIYSGYNTGVPVVLCIQNMWPHLRSLRPYWYERAAAWTAIHRVGINVLLETPMAKEGLDVLRKLNLLTEFGIDKCEWIPYWHIDKMLTIKPDELKMSVYRRSDGAMVCALANMSDKPVEGVIDFSRSPELTLKPGAACKDFVDQAAVKINGTKMYVDLGPYAGKLARIE
ncbi:MAG: glycoside hydrolase domain-containing protein [Planctomycetota bacterium]